MKRTLMFIVVFTVALTCTVSFAQCPNGRCGSAAGFWTPFGWYTQPTRTKPVAKQAVPQQDNPSIVKSEEEKQESEATEPEQTCDKESCVEVTVCPFATRVISLINYHRSRAGLPPLTADIGLSNGCQRHSIFMASGGGFQHAYGGGMECIAMGVRTPEALVNMWMNSSGHRAILMSRGHRVGVGSSGVYHTLRVR